MKAENPEEAVDEFLGVPALEPEKGDWYVACTIWLLQALMKFVIGVSKDLSKQSSLSSSSNGTQRLAHGSEALSRSDQTNLQKAIEHYQELLTYVKSAVTRNYSEKSINNMLDFIEKAAEDEAAHRCMEEFYSKTLESFQSTNNERLWLKTNIKLARLWLERKDFLALTDKLRELHKACQRDDGSDDPSKGTYSLEVYALEILMYAETRNNKRLKVGRSSNANKAKLSKHQALYQRALKVRSAIPHPNIMGIIREAGGKMHMSEGNVRRKARFACTTLILHRKLGRGSK